MIDVGIGVITIICGGAVGIAVAVCDSVCVCSSGHGAQSKISIVCRNGREICGVNGGFTKPFRAQSAEEKRGDRVPFVATTQEFSPQGNSNPFEICGFVEFWRPDSASQIPVKHTGSAVL